MGRGNEGKDWEERRLEKLKCDIIYERRINKNNKKKPYYYLIICY